MNTDHKQVRLYGTYSKLQKRKGRITEKRPIEKGRNGRYERQTEGGEERGIDWLVED